ncbi:ImmA/IrrE family metallo-endopeptidase, partial [Campylobacter jejuni]|nr:ImmA/IrrE family metallo-endopeptidase [Campylobacter jejuni]
LTNFDFTSRKLEKFSINDKPCEVATQMQFLLDKNISDDKKFLKYFIDNLAKHNILVIEEVQHSNLKFKSNLCGFFMKPNIIVLRKQQSRKREIFTLAHEVGHYLLTHEHIDKNIFDESVDLEEKWCNEFAFNFLIGSEIDELNNIAKHDIDINNEMILEISKKNILADLLSFIIMLITKKLVGKDITS